MTYTSLGFYLLVLLVLILYYTISLRFRWVALLIGSIAFYYLLCKEGFLILLITALLSYGAGLLLQFFKEKYTASRRGMQRLILFLSLLPALLPWILIKNGNFLAGILIHKSVFEWIVPLGISFYTLQIVSYLVDIYNGKIDAQKNPAKYLLFLMFFPQIIQGPIPRYERVAGQLYEGHSFHEEKFVRGVQLILWGFFLKFMIADRADIIVSTVFGAPEKYAGFYVFVAAALYNIGLYTDFLACVTISQGVAGLFGINLADNFRRPYFATSIREFWGRWHISLSTWLRDYIYIPLGGGRKGTFRKYVNLILTFAFSAIWHGSGYKFLFWGLIHATYQIVGSLTAPFRNRLYQFFRLSEQSGTRKTIQRIGVFFWTMLAEITFRADSLRIGLYMIKRMFLVWNPWIFFNDSLLRLGLGWKEWCILLLSIAVLLYVSILQEKGTDIREMILHKAVYIRWTLYILTILCIMVFGIYGFGYQGQEFIYGGF